MAVHHVLDDGESQAGAAELPRPGALGMLVTGAWWLLRET